MDKKKHTSNQNNWVRGPTPLFSKDTASKFSKTRKTFLEGKIFLRCTILEKGVYRFIQTSYFRFIQTVIPPVHLEGHTSGSSRVFILPVHLDFIHTSGSSRFFSYLWFIQNIIPLVHLDFIQSTGSSRTSYLWFIQVQL